MRNVQYSITAIDPVIADALRAGGGTIYAVDENPGYPCRQCLLDAQVGDEVVLVSHDPFDHESPYRSAGPIFLHRHACTDHAGPLTIDAPTLPAQLTVRRLAVRAFDDTEMMLDAALIEGAQLGTTIDDLFADAAVHHLHVHNAARGCWAARIDRQTS